MNLLKNREIKNIIILSAISFIIFTLISMLFLNNWFNNISSRYGEKNIAFELKNSGIPMYILHDIYLESDDLSAQIDYIVVTRKVVFII